MGQQGRTDLALWRSLFRESAQQLGARVATAAGQFITLWAVGRVGGDAVLAQYVLALAAAGLLGVAIDSGSGLWAVRLVAKGEVLPRLTKPRLVTLALGGLALAILGPRAGLLLASLPWVVSMGLLMALSTWWRGVLWGRRLYSCELVASVLQAGASLAGLALLFSLAKGSISPSMPLVATAGGWCCGYALRRITGCRSVQVHRDALDIRPWVREVVSYAGQAYVTTAQTQSDTLLLGALWAGPAPGIAAYGVAMRLYYSLGMPFESLGVSVIPRIAAGTRLVWTPLLRVAPGLAIFTVGVMLLITRHGAVFGLGLQGQAYLRIVGLVLALGLPLRLAAYVLGGAATGCGRQSARFRASLAGLTTMLALDAVLIPSLGPLGAAVALVVADAVLVGGYFVAARSALLSEGVG